MKRDMHFKVPPQTDAIVAGAATWWACLWLGQPLGLFLGVCSATRVIGPVIGAATVANASVAAGEVTRTITAARIGSPRYNKSGRRPPPRVFCVCTVWNLAVLQCSSTASNTYYKRLATSCRVGPEAQK